MGIMDLLEPPRIAKNRNRGFRGLDMRVILARPQALTNDLREALTSPVGLSGETLTVDKYDIGHRS